MKPFNWTEHIEHARALIQEAEKRANVEHERVKSGSKYPLISFTTESATDAQLIGVIGWSLQKTIDQVAADALAKMPGTVEVAP